MAEVRATEALRNMQDVAVRMSDKVEPGFVGISGSDHHEGVAFPPSYRVAHPGRIWIRRKRAPVREDLTKPASLVQNHDHVRRLNNPYRIESRQARARSFRKAADGWIIGAVGLETLVEERLRPRQHVDARDVGPIAQPADLPHP